MDGQKMQEVVGYLDCATLKNQYIKLGKHLNLLKDTRGNPMRPLYEYTEPPRTETGQRRRRNRSGLRRHEQVEEMVKACNVYDIDQEELREILGIAWSDATCKAFEKVKMETEPEKRKLSFEEQSDAYKSAWQAQKEANAFLDGHVPRALFVYKPPRQKFGCKGPQDESSDES